MEKKSAQISGGQLILLLVTLVGSTAILYAPAMSIREAGQNAWLSILLPATLYGFLVVLVTTKLALRFPGHTFSQYNERILGTWLARLVGFLYLLFILSLLIIVVREYGNFLSNAFMPETPIQVFVISLIVLASFAANGGVEVISRMNQFLLPLVLMVMGSILLFILKDVNLLRLLPFLDEGLGPVLKGSVVPSVFRGEVFVLMWLVYHLKRPQESVKMGAWAVLVLTVILVVDVALIVMVMGKELAAREAFPTLLLIRFINIGTFINRVEGLVMVVWVAGVVIKASILLNIAIEVAKDTFQYKKSSWYLIVPIGFLLMAGSLYSFKNDPQFIWFRQHVFPPYSLVFQLVLPSLILFWAWISKKGA